MLMCYSLVKRFRLRLLFIFVSVFIIQCDRINSSFSVEKENYCPFIEELSFESDIDIKCNNTYLVFNERNNEKLNWKFANQSSFCRQKEKQQAFVNECNITRIDSKYLKVPLKSLHGESACVYCPINYKPIAPMIIVTQDHDDQHHFYKFNLTATGLAHYESFEILWAKRVSDVGQNSLKYWFLQRCIFDPIMNTPENTGHTIIFTVDDVPIRRVEFIIRRCSGTCQTYHRCNEDEEFSKKTPSNNFQTPDSIEKISWNYDCLNGIVSTTINNTTDKDALLSTTQSSNKKLTKEFLILFPILGLLIVLLFIMLGCFIISRMKGLRTDNVYRKTSNINLDEKKENME